MSQRGRRPEPQRQSTRVLLRQREENAPHVLLAQINVETFALDPVASRLRQLASNDNSSRCCVFACSIPCSHPTVAPVLPHTP